MKSTDIKNQGDNERYWTQENFTSHYKAQKFDRYKGVVTSLNKNNLSYDGIVMTTGFMENEYRILFEKGIFYPALFSGYTDGRVLEVQKKPDSTHRNLSYLLSRNDSLGVGIMEELKFLNPSAKIRRYKLYLSRPGFANRSMYIFELTNDNATIETDLKNFLFGAKLTFLKFISILL
jgi:hypothetical protein